MPKALGYAANHSFGRLKPLEFERHAAGPGEIEIDVLFCGVCHSDIHQAANDWGNTVYPCMPGHEVVGRVTRVGEGVTQHAVGDMVGIGCIVDSCGQCEPCQHGEQNYCEGPNGFLATYNGPTVPAKMAPDGVNTYGRDNTYGGYSTSYTVRADFALKIPAGLDPAAAAPILCAGVTTYSPLKHWGVKAGDKVGVLGIGGLGHMAVKLAKAMGAEVWAFTTSRNKFDEIAGLGTTPVLAGDEDTMKSLAGSFDFILSTIPEKHDVNPYLPLLKRNKTLTLVGALEPMAAVNNMPVAGKRLSVAGSMIGGILETQEVLDFCAKHGVAPEIQIIPIQQINEAYRHVNKGDVRFRYVIDIASLREEAAA